MGWIRASIRQMHFIARSVGAKEAVPNMVNDICIRRIGVAVSPRLPTKTFRVDHTDQEKGYSDQKQSSRPASDYMI